MKKSCWMFIAFVIIFHTAISRAEASELSPDEVYERMFQNAQITVNTATGKYYKKTLNSRLKTDDEIQSEINKSVEPYKKRESITIEEYKLSGSKFRKDQWLVPEMNDDQEMKAYIKQLRRNPDNIFAWDGETYAILAPSKFEGDPSAELGPGPDFLSLSSKHAPGDKPSFLIYGREVESKDLLNLFRKQGQPISIEQTNWNGNEEALLLRIGEKGSVGFLMEMTILPNKGYVLAHSRAMWGGAPQLEEEYGNFVQTSAGFWVPLKIKRLAYKLSKNQVPFISSSVEMVALEEPKVNVKINDDIFDLYVTSKKLFATGRSLMVSDQRNGKNVNYQIPVIDFLEQLDQSSIISSKDQTQKSVPENTVNVSEAVNTSVDQEKHDNAKVKIDSTDARRDEQEKRNRSLFWRPIIIGVVVVCVGLVFFSLINLRSSRKHKVHK